eukprot:1644895-Pyramimonas_sp.AAC.1
MLVTIRRLLLPMLGVMGRYLDRAGEKQQKRVDTQKLYRMNTGVGRDGLLDECPLIVACSFVFEDGVFDQLEKLAHHEDLWEAMPR